MNMIIDKINKIKNYNDIDIARQMIKYVSQCYIDNQFEDFILFAEKWHNNIYVIFFYDNFEPKILTWEEFCDIIIEQVEEYNKLNWKMILKVNIE